MAAASTASWTLIPLGELMRIPFVVVPFAVAGAVTGAVLTPLAPLGAMLRPEPKYCPASGGQRC